MTDGNMGIIQREHTWEIIHGLGPVRPRVKSSQLGNNYLLGVTTSQILGAGNTMIK